jgi:hypothetical protein
MFIRQAVLAGRAVRARQGHESAHVGILDKAFPADRAAPLVTVLDGHPHALGASRPLRCRRRPAGRTRSYSASDPRLRK